MEKIHTKKNHIAEFAPENLKVLVFDVDDTVTRGTTGIKKKAWDALFSDQLDLLQEARELYEYTGNGDRYNMIAHVLGEEQDDCTNNAHVQKLADTFEQHVQYQIRENGMDTEDIAALISLKRSFNGPMYLLSATPQNSVVGNMDYFQTQYPELEVMFTDIIGNPMDGGKAGELAKIAEACGCSIDQVLMVGDGGSDYNGAKGSGSQFVGLNPNNHADKWPDDTFPKLASVAELPSLFN